MTKQPLFRKVNTTARGVRHQFGGNFRDGRHTKASQRSDANRLSMHGKAHRGLDYTPLFRFLLSKVGGRWNDIHAEAVSRLDRPDPIYWLVALAEHDRKDCVGIGDSSYYSGLFVDDDGLLQIVNPSIGPATLVPSCKCCTHTFNGVRFTQAFPGPLAAAGPADDAPS